MKGVKGIFLQSLISVTPLISLPSLHAMGFEDIIAGARVGGLGGSYAAIAQGHQSLFVNPAGLSALLNESFYTGIGHYYGGPMSVYHGSYAKPLYQGIVLASGWQSARSTLHRLDRFYLTWSQQEAGMPWIPKSVDHRFSWGMSFRALNALSRPATTDAFTSRIGAGLDAGMLIEFREKKIQFGASLIGLDSENLDLSGPFVNLGAMKRWNNLALAVDYRARFGYATFFPSIEYDFYGGLAQLRAGRGVRLGELQTVALGIGVNLLPLTMDFAFHLPPEGLHRQEGAAMVSVGYSFGGRRFYEKFVGLAASEAQSLSQEIINLEKKKKIMAKDLANTEADLKVLRQEIDALDKRRREEAVKDDIRQTDLLRPKEEGEKPKDGVPGGRDELPPRPAKRPLEWPKRHRVDAGDTLRKIAADYYGDPAYWELIYKVNQDKILRGLPVIGETLEIPKPE